MTRVRTFTAAVEWAVSHGYVQVSLFRHFPWTNRSAEGTPARKEQEYILERVRGGMRDDSKGWQVIAKHESMDIRWTLATACHETPSGAMREFVRLANREAKERGGEER